MQKYTKEAHDTGSLHQRGEREPTTAPRAGNWGTGYVPDYTCSGQARLVQEIVEQWFCTKRRLKINSVCVALNWSPSVLPTPGA